MDSEESETSTSKNNQSLVTVNEIDRKSSMVIDENERKLCLQKETMKDKRKFPLDKYTVMILFYILMIVVNLAKGTKKFESLIGIEK